MFAADMGGDRSVGSKGYVQAGGVRSAGHRDAPPSQVPGSAGLR